MQQWPGELQAFTDAFAVVKKTWNGDPIGRPEDLKFQVGQYESAVRGVTESGGYGNLLLADTLRRLNLCLLSRYLLTHPSDFATVDQMLNHDRVRLLDSGALADVIREELKLAPPPGGWRLSGSRSELELVFKAAHTSSLAETGRTLLGEPGPSKIILTPDVGGLLMRLITSDFLEHILLPAIVEFLRRGGTIADYQSFDRVMADRKEALWYPPFGATLYASDMGGLIRRVQTWEGKKIPLTMVVGD